MNNNFVRLAFVGIACAAFCTTTFAAPKGGNHGRPAKAAPQARPMQTRAPQASARPAAKPVTARPAAPARHVDRPTVARHDHARPEPRHHAPPPRPEARHHAPPPPRAVRHHLPSHARYCARPAVPMWRVGALRAWEWIAQEWAIIVDGVYYYGDGYYYDGCNYYYNGAYHTAPPMSIFS